MWQPEEESLKMLVDLLNESQLPNNEKQREIHNKITELSTNPEFASYLVYILGLSNNPNLNTIRRIAGAILKGVMERNFDKVSVPSLDYVKLKLMEAFNDPSSGIRNTVTNAITALLTKIGFQNWTELMKFLILNLEVDHQEYVESSLECTYKILEDIEANQDFNYQEDKYQSFIAELIPKLLFLCDPKLPPKIKALAISSLNLFVSSMPPALANNFPMYYEMLMVSAQDQNVLVRQKSCEGFLAVLETKRRLVVQSLQKTIEKLLQLTLDPENSVRKVACRFWNEYLSFEQETAEEMIGMLAECLSILLPALVNCLHYTEEDILNGSEERYDLNKSNKDNLFSDGGDQVDSRQEGLESNDKEGQQGAWTLRREAAIVLDRLADKFREDVFLKAQERIAESLRNSEWRIKESGILCLGILAEGAYNAIIPHLKDLYPFLMASLDDQNPFVRASSCWALSRFNEWIVEQGKLDQTVMQTYLQKILQKMMDENGNVQEASCSALCKVAHRDAALVEKYVYDIVEVIKHVYENYRKKSLANLYDVIASLALTIPKEKIQEVPVQNTILEILMKKWNDCHFNDRGSISLVGCTDSIIKLIGSHAVVTYAEFFIPRLLYLIFNYIRAKKEDDRKFLNFKKDIAVLSFDFLGTFLSNIGIKNEKFINPDDFLNIFGECVQDQDLSIRRVALASGGEIAKYCPSILQGRVERIVQAYMDNLVIVPIEYDPEGFIDACCNNSCWAIGEIALAFPTEFGNFVPQFAQKISDLLSEDNMLKTDFLKQNLSVALGRFGLVNPEAVANLLEQFLKPFCDSLDNIKDDPEKQQAFRGLFLAISKNPNGIVKDFVYLCQALVNFENAEGDVQGLASKLVNNFKAVAGQLWDSYFENFPFELQEKMKQRFGV